MNRTAQNAVSLQSGRVPSKCLVAVPLLLLFSWAGGLGFAGLWIWTEGTSLVNPMHSYLLVASLFGALGGLVRTIQDLQNHVYHIWLYRTGKLETIPGSPLNNYLLKPVLWPIAGAAFGVVLTAILLDEGTSHLKVALLGAVGGLLWRTILRKLPGAFNVTKEES